MLHYTKLCLSSVVVEVECELSWSAATALLLFDWPLLSNTFVAALVAVDSAITGCCGNTDG